MLVLEMGAGGKDDRGRTVTTSTPFSASSWAAGFDVSRVIPRILNSCESLLSLRSCVITDPPWLPVAPNTVMILDMVVEYIQGTVYLSDD
jgi:hypothetical protein